MDLRNYYLQQDKTFDGDLDITIVDNIEEYIKYNDVDVCKLVISSKSDLSNVKKEILSIEDLSVITIKKFGEYKDTIINKEYEYLDLSPKGINKNTALNVLKDYLHLNNSEVMAIGDNLNDLEMVKNSGVGVAVANAYDELKQVASYTTQNSVENGGFAEAVYKFIEF